MANNDKSSADARAARIRALETELAQLRAGAALPAMPNPESASPHTPPTWLVDTLRYLLSEHNSAGVNYSLQQLVQALGLEQAGLWHFDAFHHCLASVAQWPPSATDTPAWVLRLLADRRHSLSALQAGQVLTFFPHELPEPESSRALAQALLDGSTGAVALVPVQRNHNTVGLIALQRSSPQPWTTQELDSAALVAELLIAVDERQQLLAKLAERDTRFQYAMEAARDGLWDWDIASGRVYFSHSYLRMLGYEFDGLPNHIDTLSDCFLHPEDREQVLAQYRAALDNQRTYINLEFRLRHKSGRVLWIYSRAKFVEPDSSGRARRCVGLNADITEFIHAKEELLQAKTEADLANRTKGEFLARMSHEIRTPMNAIIGLGHLLQDSHLDIQQRSYLSSMNAAAESLLHIINQVLDFSKIDSGKIILDNSHFDLEQVLEKLSRLFEVSALHKKVDIVYDLAPDVPRFLRGDALRLNQILSHLVSNALEYSERDDVIVRIALRQSDTQGVNLQFDIIGSGGLSAQQIQQLQQSLERTRPEPGTDESCLGFDICRHLIRLMQGDIHLYREPGHGCHLRFNAQFEHSHIGAQPLREQHQRLAQLRTLVVDDNRIACDIIASTARLINLRVDTANSAAAALERIRAAEHNNSPYQLVLMDYKMPGINGLEATTLIKADDQLHHKPQVVLVSSYHRDEILQDQHCAELVDGFISKPVSESRLFDTISSVFEHAPATLEPAADAPPDQLHGLRVLVVEDNQVNQQVINGMLRKRGVQVTLADNGRHALELLHANPEGFDLILMDIEMPEMGGFDATAAIRQGEHCPQIPIVAVTAQAMRGDREACIKAGMNGYLSKPIKPDLLYASLTDILRSQSLNSDQ